MTAPVSSILYPVTDMNKAKPIFTTLFGLEPATDSPYYVGYEVNGLQVGLVPGGHEDGVTGPLPYVTVENIEQAVADLVAAGAEIVTPVRSVGPGGTVAVVKDTDGSAIGLIQNPD